MLAEVMPESSEETDLAGALAIRERGRECCRVAEMLLKRVPFASCEARSRMSEVPTDNELGIPCGVASFHSIHRPWPGRQENSSSRRRTTMLWPFIFLTSTSSAVRKGNPRRSAKAT